MFEEWRDVKGYEGIYQVSSYGNIRRLLKSGKSKSIKLVVTPQGYVVVTLCNRSQKVSKVHRLVAEAFIPNPDNLPQVNHKDEDKTNNNVDNLEWCDARYNSNYGTRCQRISIANKGKSGLSGEANGMYGVHRCGKDAPFYGREHTDATKAKIQSSKLGKRLSDDTRAKMRASHNTEQSKALMSSIRKEYFKNRTDIWINNGVVRKRIDISELPGYIEKGFVRGKKMREEE